MPLKSMKITEQEKKEESSNSVLDKPSYPYGLKIHIDEDSFAKLGLGEIPQVGKKMTMLAQVEVTDVHQNEKGDDMKYTSIGLQITDMALQKASKEEQKDAGTVLYGSAEG